MVSAPNCPKPTTRRAFAAAVSAKLLQQVVCFHLLGRGGNSSRRRSYGETEPPKSARQNTQRMEQFLRSCPKDGRHSRIASVTALGQWVVGFVGRPHVG